MEPILLKPEQIIFDEEIYPRCSYSWMTVVKYKDKMLMGEEFPPIVVGKIKGYKGYYLVDGKHRLEAYKELKKQYISVICKKYKSKLDAFLDAFKLNSKNALPLTPQDLSKVVYVLEKNHYTLQQISEIMRMPLEKVERLRLRIIERNDDVIFLKAPLYKDDELRKMLRHASKEEIEKIQKYLNTHDQLIIIENFERYIPIFDYDNPKIVAKILVIYKKLKETLMKKRMITISVKTQ